MNHTGTITNLIRCIPDGDVAAMDELFCSVMQRLADMAEQRLRTFPQLARQIPPEELISETYEGVAEALSGGEVRNSGHFFAIASKRFHWRLLDLIEIGHQLHEVEMLEEVTSDGDGPLNSAEERELLHLTLQASLELEEPLQTIISLYYWGGFTTRDIADYLEQSPTFESMSKSTVDRHLKKTLKKLRRQIAQEGFGDEN